MFPQRQLPVSMLRSYLRELERRVTKTLQPVGVYLLGSAATGEFVEGESDVDVAVVCDAAPDPEALDRLVTWLDHSELPCPARLLELVVYSRESLGKQPVEFELNLNTGEGIATHTTHALADEPWFWFTLDVHRARDTAIALSGPPPAEVFPELPEDLVQAAFTAWRESS